jgi:hypothetical protein
MKLESMPLSWWDPAYGEVAYPEEGAGLLLGTVNGEEKSLSMY